MKKQIAALFLCLIIMFQMIGCAKESSPKHSFFHDVNEQPAAEETSEKQAVIPTNTEKIGEEQTVVPTVTEEQKIQEPEPTSAPYIKFIEAKTPFSDGLCWAVVEHMPQGQRKVAVIDKKGNIKCEIPMDRYVEFNAFHNGIALVVTNEDVWQYVNENGDVLFSSDDADFHEQIHGMYDDGYIYLVKREASFDSSEIQESVWRCTKNGIECIYGWETISDVFYSYLGAGVFSAAESWIGSSDEASACIYNLENENPVYQWLNGDNGISLNSLRVIPDGALSVTDGWFAVKTAYGSLLVVDSKMVESYFVEEIEFAAFAQYGLCSDGCIVILSDNTLGYFDTQAKEYYPIDYKHFSQIIKPERFPMYYTPGYTPVSNFLYTSPEIMYEISDDCVDLGYSEGAMMLRLRGKDGKEYFTLIDKSGNDIIEPTVGCAVETLGNGRFEVLINNEVYVYAADGSNGLPEYDESEFGKIKSIDQYSDGVAYITTERGYKGFVDTEGNIVFDVDELIAQ